MVASSIRKTSWRGAVAAVMILAPFWGPGTSADEIAASPRPDAARARRVMQALRELQASVRNETEGKGKETVHLKRPAKVVQAPTLTPAQVDALLERANEGGDAKPSPLTEDEAFARRVYLDVTGKLPSPAEIAEFRKSGETDKRARLIDRLLASPDYARNWARYWRDVLQFHASNPNPVQVRYPVLEKWLAEQIGKNAPWDKVAEALITASGRNDESGPANFAIAQMGQPVEIAGEVSRVFMGVQIQCAQCHDHPTDPWKRQQFHEFASFFAGLRQPRRVTPPQERPPVFAVAEQPGRPRYTMPDLKDPKTSIPVSPKFFLASSEAPVPASLTSADRRALAASFVTGQDNPWFAKAFVNRIWTTLIGSGFYNPVDDIGPTRTANAPEVLEALASQWQQGGYDVRWLFRTILNTAAYQREARPAGASGAADVGASCPVRLRADQLLDALTHALDVPFDTPPQAAPPQMAAAGDKAKGAAAKGANAQALELYRRQVRNPRTFFNILFGVDPSTPRDDVLGTIPQALFLMNNPRINRAVEAKKGTVLGRILADRSDDAQALEALYLRVLARRPNAAEVEVCNDYVKKVGDRNEAFEDIYWNLINSTEFLSRR